MENKATMRALILFQYKFGWRAVARVSGTMLSGRIISANLGRFAGKSDGINFRVGVQSANVMQLGS